MKPAYLCATLLYCVAIFALSSRSSVPDTGWNLLDIPGFDKLAHALLYAGLAGLVSTGIRRSDPRVLNTVQFWLPIVFATAYGLSDEIHQYFVPNRTFDLFDIVADATGATMVQIYLIRYRWSSTTE